MVEELWLELRVPIEGPKLSVNDDAHYQVNVTMINFAEIFHSSDRNQ